MNSGERIKYLETRVEKLEARLKQLRLGRRVLINLLEKYQQEKAQLKLELSDVNCFTCTYRQKKMEKSQ